MSKFKISIIIVNWNSSAYLYDCLNSIYSNAINYPFEVIVVDNCSSDNSVEMVKHNFPSVNLVCNTSNYGFAKANNIGIKCSDGEYICFVNSDVKILDNCVNALCHLLDSNKDIGIVGPKILFPNLEWQRSCMGFPTLWNQFCCALKLDTFLPWKDIFGTFMFKYRDLDTTTEVDVINGCFWLVRKDAIIWVGLLDERYFIYGEDIDWCKRFHQASWKVVYFPHVSSIHYGGGSSKNAPVRFYVEMQKANYQYWKKHNSKFHQIAYLGIKAIHQVVRIVGNYIKYVYNSSDRTDIKYKISRSKEGIKWIFSYERKDS